MTRTQVYFEEKQKNDLLFLAAKQNKSFSQVLRDVVSAGLKTIGGDMFVDREKRLEIIKKYAGFDKRKIDPNMSKNINKILYDEPYK